MAAREQRLRRPFPLLFCVVPRETAARHRRRNAFSRNRETVARVAVDRSDRRGVGDRGIIIITLIPPAPFSPIVVQSFGSAFILPLPTASSSDRREKPRPSLLYSPFRIRGPAAHCTGREFLNTLITDY